MNRKIYSYQPDEFFDFGIAGEKPVTFLAWINPGENGQQESVDIWRAYASGPNGAEWDFTREIHKYPERRRNYEDEIRADYLKKQERDWEDIA